MAFASDSIRTLIIRVLLLIFGTIGGIINARWLGPEGLGIFALLRLVPEISFRFGNLGFGSSLAFFMARGNYTTNSVIRLTVMVGILLSACLTTLLWTVWRHSMSPWQDIEPSLFYTSLLGIPALFVSSFFQRIISGQLRIAVLNLSHIISSVSYILLLVVLVVVFELSAFGALVAFLVSHALSLLFMWVHLELSRENDSSSRRTANYRQFISQCWRYGRWNYLTMLTRLFVDQVPVIVLKLFGGNSAVGLFSVGRSSMNRVLLILPDTFANILFPFTAASKEKDAVRRTNILCRNFLFIMACLSAVLVLCVDWIVRMVYGEAFLTAVPVCYALIPSVLFFPVYKFITVHISASGSPKLVSKVNMYIVPVALLVSFTLIPRYGAVGAAVSISATYIALSVVNLVVYRNYTKTGLTEIVMPRWSDRVYYMRLARLSPFDLLRRAA